MLNSEEKELTDMARFFLEPSNTTHRQYEALRAYFVDHLPSAEAARRFGYTPGSFRVLCHEFRRNPKRDFFLPLSKATKVIPKKKKLRDTIVTLRKQNLSIYDIQKTLIRNNQPLSAPAISTILKEEGFARLTRRHEDERPETIHPEAAAIANVNELDLSSRQFRTKFGGLFLFLPYLAAMPLEKIFHQAGLPGSKMIPAGQAIRSLLALKLFGNARHSHVMSSVFDEGLSLFAGLNVIPKRSFLTEYSCRIDPGSYPKLMQLWFNSMKPLGLLRGNSFDLDFHTIPFHGEEALIQKHFVSKRSRRQKGILAFLAQDASTRVFCYANAQLRKEDQNDEILRFVEFWKARTGKNPEELIFDSKLTTYTNLNLLNKQNIDFMTLRRRSLKMIHAIAQEPISAWRRIELDGVARIYKTPRILDRKINLPGYEGLIRELIIMDLGHEEPTLLLTNQMQRSPAKLIGRYAQRMIIENGIADSIDFFHMDALSSAVAMKVDCDLQLTLMASSLYRLLAADIGNGYQTAKSRHIFRDFIDATAQVTIGEKDIQVRFQKRAHNPYLIAAGFAEKRPVIPWLNKKRLKIVFG